MTPERIDQASGEWDEDGFYLRVQTDDEEHVFRVTDTATARELLRAVAPLQEWVAEEATQRAAYDAASPEERDRWLREDEDLVRGDDAAEQMREAADLARKRERENPPQGPGHST